MYYKIMKKTKKDGLLSPRPSAFICSTKDRGRKQQKNKKVFLSDNEEFCLELFNPLPTNILCMIHINDVPISKSGVLLEKNQRVYIDSFLDTSKKFVFKHLKSEECKSQSTQLKNVIEVHFYNEKVDVEDLLIRLQEVRDQERKKEEEEKSLINIFNSTGTYITTGTIGLGTTTPNLVWYGTPNSITTGTIGLDTSTTTDTSLILPYVYSTMSSSTNISNLALSSGVVNSNNTTYFVDGNGTFGTIVEGRDEKAEQYKLKENNIEPTEVDEFFINKEKFLLYPDELKPITKKDMEKTHTTKEISSSKLEQLKELKELYDSKFLTEEEVSILKAEIIRK